MEPLAQAVVHGGYHVTSQWALRNSHTCQVRMMSLHLSESLGYFSLMIHRAHCRIIPRVPWDAHGLWSAESAALELAEVRCLKFWGSRSTVGSCLWPEMREMSTQLSSTHSGNFCSELYRQIMFPKLKTSIRSFVRGYMHGMHCNRSSRSKRMALWGTRRK